MNRQHRVQQLAITTIVAAAVSIVATLAVFGQRLPGSTTAWLLPVLASLVGLASAAVVPIRIRSTTAGSTWTDAAILVGIVVLPPAWVPLGVFLGVFVAKLLVRVGPLRAAYNAGKDCLAATVGLLIALGFGLSGTTQPLREPLGLVAVAVGISLAEYAIGVPVMSLLSGTPWLRMISADPDIKVASFLGKLITAGFTLALWQLDARLLIASLPVALGLHLTYSGRVRSRAERAAWQRLAATTEKLNRTDLGTVLGAAVVGAAQLFAAVEAEVFLRRGPDGPLLVRGDADAVTWTGDPGHSPPRDQDGHAITVRMVGSDRPDPYNDLGEVRLYYSGRANLTDREQLTLQAFVSALRNAVSNASAYTRSRRLAAAHAHASVHDSVTGLANRLRLRDYGESLLGRPGYTVLIIIDIDHFREVNETLGHVAGDHLLLGVARRLANRIGQSDLLARLGGDEFAILLVGLTDLEQAQARARELLALLDEPVDVSGMRVRVEASAGVAGLDATTQLDAGPGAQPAAARMSELLRRADVAMYQAKRGGDRVVCYDAGKDTADVTALILGGELPRAVAQREFVVNFQPIVDLATGVMISAEALARWHHPQWGDLNPRRFLAAVERSGLLPAFDEAVLDQALRAVSRWQEAGISAPIAVNASPRSLLDANFARMVIARLAEAKVNGADLIIELTEALSLGQVALARPVLDELRAAGVRFALDDFGTGRSSLAMLNEVPVVELKIDRSFVVAMRTRSEATAVVRSTVELARSLGLLVVAEGVEQPAEREALIRLGCDAGQGHLFAKPMPIDALLDVLRVGCGGVPGRLIDPIGPAGTAGAREHDNVIELWRARNPPPSRASG